jgi:HK97 family phage major capsid protein
MDIRELMQKRARLLGEARKIVETADTDKRAVPGLTAEETQRYDALMEEHGKLSQEIERREKLEQLEAEQRELQGEGHRPDPQNAVAEAEYRAAGFTPEQAARLGSALHQVIKYRAEQRQALHRVLVDPNAPARIELRALQQDADIYGGYLVTPVQFVQELIQAVDNQVFVRQWATKYQVPNADALGVPSLDNDPADPSWTSELLVGSEDSTMSFGKRELHPHPLAKYIKVSRKLLRSVPDAEALVRDRLAYKFAVTEESAFITGTGAGQPLGVMVASANGINTDRDVSTDNTATAITMDGLKNAKYTLKGNYWPSARWLFHRDAVKMIAKLKDGEGQYLWAESVRVGEPDRLLNFPCFMSEYMSNTFTTGLYVGILGDIGYYWIADALSMDMQRLVELYAATNQVGFIGRLECDGMPVLSEAFVRVKLGT